MKLVPMIIDVQPAYLLRQGAPSSLLLSSVGTQTLFEWLCGRLEGIGDAPPTVLATFPVQPAYSAALRALALPPEQITSLDSLDALLSQLEPSDWLLIVDPRYVPIDPLSFGELVQNVAESRTARHLVAMHASPQGTKEYLQLDAQDRVQRIQRYYDGVTWLQTRAVSAALVPVSALHGLPGTTFRVLTALREALVREGVVSRDIGLAAGVFDLNEESGLVQLCESVLRDVTQDAPPPGFRVHAPGVWTGPRCRIDPTARLHGPIILHEDVQLDADVTLVGPTLVGGRSRIHQDSVLAQCLVAPQTVVSERSVWQHCLLCGNGGREPALTGGAGGSDAYYASAPGHPLLKQLRVVLPKPPGGRCYTARRRDKYVAIKRVVDGVIALLGLLVLSPLLLLTALAVKLTSRGPVFFYHQREGKDGKPFCCCKFRTMVADAHRQQRDLYRQNAVDGPQFKLRHDPRITWLGRWLRETNIDELPQLFNVVLGQMSLIGPRPSPFRENQICVPWREARLAVRPGITGLWQVCRCQRSTGDFHQWIHYDMLYVRYLSPRLDLKILLATLLTLCGRWSVPVSWFIPADLLRQEYDASADRRQGPDALPAEPINN